MTVVIKPRRTPTASKVPTTAELDDGEIAINSTDKKIYLRVGPDVVEVANAATGGGGSTPTGSGYRKIVAGVEDAAASNPLISELSMTSARILGRWSAGTGATQELTVGAGLSLATGVLGRPAFTGDVTATANSNALSIASNAVVTAKIANANVTLPKLANIASNTVIGNVAGVAATPVALTASQLRAMLGASGPRVVNTSGSAHTPDVATTDHVLVGYGTSAMTFNNPTGTPVDGQVLVIRGLSSGAMSLAWGTAYQAIDVALPTAISAVNKSFYFEFMYDLWGTGAWLMIRRAITP